MEVVEAKIMVCAHVLSMAKIMVCAHKLSMAEITVCAHKLFMGEITVCAHTLSMAEITVCVHKLPEPTQVLGLFISSDHFLSTSALVAASEANPRPKLKLLSSSLSILALVFGDSLDI